MISGELIGAWGGSLALPIACVRARLCLTCRWQAASSLTVCASRENSLKRGARGVLWKSDHSLYVRGEQTKPSGLPSCGRARTYAATASLRPGRGGCHDHARAWPTKRTHCLTEVLEWPVDRNRSVAHFGRWKRSAPGDSDDRWTTSVSCRSSRARGKH